MKRFEKHIFICENERPEGHPRSCCKNKGGFELKEKFKQRIKELGLNDSVRINSAGCLDACEYGAALVVYPEQVWYGAVTLNDVEEILQSHIICNKYVDRLMIKDKRFLRDENKI
jgi:(2Fe-2S) ferredoxin